MEELLVLNSHWGWVKVDEGITRSDLVSVFPCILLLSVGLWGFSITGFLIKKFPAREIKLNRQYKHNKKSILQLTFLLYVIERLCSRLIQLCIYVKQLSFRPELGWGRVAKKVFLSKLYFQDKWCFLWVRSLLSLKHRGGNFPFASLMSYVEYSEYTKMSVHWAYQNSLMHIMLSLSEESLWGLSFILVNVLGFFCFATKAFACSCRTQM